MTRTVVCEAMEPRTLLSVSFFPSSASTSVPGATPEVGAAHFLSGGKPISLDVVTNSAVDILSGAGDGTFTVAGSTPIPPNPALGNPFVWGGFNGSSIDGVMLSQNSTTHVGIITYETNNNDGTFTAGTTTAISNGGNGFLPIIGAAVDLNGDNEADLVIVGKPTTGTSLVLAVMFSNGDGTFTEENDITISGSVAANAASGEWIAAGDLGNGSIDIVVLDNSGGKLDVFLNNGDGTAKNYTQQPGLSITGQQVVGGVFKTNGHVDLAVANGNQITLLAGDGSGAFAPQSPIALSGPVTAMGTGDVNGDSNTDLVTNQGILLGNGDETFQTPPLALPVAFAAIGNVGGGLTVADVNGDGKPDVVGLLASGNTIQAALNESAVSTTTTVSSSINPSTAGSDVKFTATVSSPLAVPTGSVEFFDGATDLGSATLSSGSAAFDAGAALAVGDHHITADYRGASDFVPSTSAVFTQTVTSNLVILFSAKAPSSVIGGQKVKISSSANLINNGATPIIGTMKEALYLASGATVDSASVLLSSATKKIDLKAGKSMKLAMKASKIPLTTPNGTYHIVLELTEPDGTKIDTAGSGSISVAPAQIVLSGTVESVHKNVATISVGNSGNVTASGPLPIEVESSADGQLADAGVITNITKKISIKPGKSLKISFKLPSGTYFLIIRLDPNNTFPAVTNPDTVFQSATAVTIT